MSYRAIKRFLGETNFELKSLVLFGLGLTILATITFALYWWQTSGLVKEGNRQAARQLIPPIILAHHWKWDQPEEMKQEFSRTIEKMAEDMQPVDLIDFKYQLFSPDPSTATSPTDRPIDSKGYEAARELKRMLRTTPDEPLELVREVEDEESAAQDEYQFYAGIVAKQSCIDCHQSLEKGSELQVGDLIGVVKISMPLDRARASIHRVFAFVISAEFVKVVLAILAIYLIVRYVITKPVMHLKKVSDAIAQGNLELRAEIRTGDEFEELSHAFNRMLRHLVTIQEELKDVNIDLDSKIDELAQVNLRLYEMNNLKNEFLATMSHELRTPLNSILGFSDVLAVAENLDERQNRYVSNIRSSGQSLLTMINDVLDLAKIESGRMEVHAIEFQIGDLVERQVNSVAPLAEKKNIDLDFSVDPQCPLLFQDIGKLEQILLNLLSNAIKFTPEGGRVRVNGLRHDARQIDLVVEDNGVGIPLDDQEAIFEKFRQGSGTPGQQDQLTREYGGTGLGLSIVKELARLLGGSVSLDSEFGKGSKFTVRIPVQHTDPVEANDDTPPGSDSQQVGLHRSGNSPLQQQATP
ncbi:MAG: ATP-binding protein [Planctomycetota bacterium]|nr:ATP-binding protein [Planctomycetota bacterium]